MTADGFTGTGANAKMVKASVIMGVLTGVSAMFMLVYPPFILGGLAIICAILSRDRSGRMEAMAILGITAAIIGIVMNIFIIATSIYTTFTDPAQYAMFDSYFRQMSGMSFETYISDMSDMLGSLK